jgi:hypothetical protein
MEQQSLEVSFGYIDSSLYILCFKLGIRGIRSIPLDDACEMELWLRGLSLSSRLLRSIPYFERAVTRREVRFDIARVSSYIKYGG